MALKYMKLSKHMTVEFQVLPVSGAQVACDRARCKIQYLKLY